MFYIKNVLAKIKNAASKLTSYFPTPLPVGLTEFNKWSDSIIQLSGKFADEDSMKFAIATMVLHLGAQKSSVPKNYFVRSLRKTAANQIAGQVFQDVKQRQAEQAEAAKKASEKEATITMVASNGQKA